MEWSDVILENKNVAEAWRKGDGCMYFKIHGASFLFTVQRNSFNSFDLRIGDKTYLNNISFKNIIWFINNFNDKASKNGMA